MFCFLWLLLTCIDTCPRQGSSSASRGSPPPVYSPTSLRLWRRRPSVDSSPGRPRGLSRFRPVGLPGRRGDWRGRKPRTVDVRGLSSLSPGGGPPRCPRTAAAPPTICVRIEIEGRGEEVRASNESSESQKRKKIKIGRASCRERV